MLTYKPTLRQRHHRCSRHRPLRAFFPVLYVLAACALSVAFPALAQTTQTQTELDVSAYESELDRIAGSLKHSEQIAQLRKSLPRAWPVRVGDKIIQVNTDWLTSDLKKLEADPAKSASVSPELTSRLLAMRNAAAALERGSSPANLDAAITQLDSILNAREFAAAAQGPNQWDIWKARIARWINEQIYKLFRRLHLGAKAGNALAWLIVCFALFALYYWLWKTLHATNGNSETPEATTQSDDPRQWARDALAAADCGDYREAVHCAYWAAVVHLETLGVLKRDRARTPRESLRLLDPHPTQQNLLRDFTSRFELIWYGYRPASANDWSEARSHLEKMGCLTPSTPATANS
jgi:Domain of unknown function (DUF4129)